jgi:hypothetical protein
MAPPQNRDRTGAVKAPVKSLEILFLASHFCGKKRRVTSGHPKIWRSHVAGAFRYRIALDYSSLGHSYSGSYYCNLGECAAAP